MWWWGFSRPSSCGKWGCSINPAQTQDGTGTPTLDLLTKFVRDVGFPIVVAGYLLLQLTPRIDALSASVETLTRAQQETNRILLANSRAINP